MSVLESGDIAISHGMQGQDAHFETLMALWEDLQLSSFDLASQPDCDLLSFAQTSFFFGVITVNRDSNSEGKLPPLPPPLAESNISTRPSVGPTNSSGSGQAAVRHKPLDSWPEEESADSRKPLFPDRGRLANEPILGLGGNFMVSIFCIIMVSLLIHPFRPQ
ncbi:hypothetical protein C8R47DRAFT_553241 [Mycena vitilis]|nr:hypothetical protein C8R47DRAFT_553241 [Mycena vitilis]